MGVGPQAIVEGLIDEFTGGLLQLMDQINTVVSIAVGDWDATIDPVEVPPETTVHLPVNWGESEWSLNFLNASFGFMAAGYKCPLEEFNRFEMLPMFGIDILPVIPHSHGGGFVYVGYPVSGGYGGGWGGGGGGGSVSGLPACLVFPKKKWNTST